MKFFAIVILLEMIALSCAARNTVREDAASPVLWAALFLIALGGFMAIDICLVLAAACTA